MPSLPPTPAASSSPSPPLDGHKRHPGHLDGPTRLYLWLAAIFVTCLLLANILGVKLFGFTAPLPEFLARLFKYDNPTNATFPISHTVGILTFPITFVLTDLLNEYYGKRAARRITFIAFAMGLLAFGLIFVARRFPTLEGIPGTATDASFENIFGAASLMYLASMVAFLAGSLLDIFLFGMFKRLTGGRMVWLRATGSTVISQLFDSFIITIMFFQVLLVLSGKPANDIGFVVKTALTGYVLKFVISVVLTPVIYAGRWAIRRFMGMTPLSATNLDV